MSVAPVMTCCIPPLYLVSLSLKPLWHTAMLLESLSLTWSHVNDRKNNQSQRSHLRNKSPNVQVMFLNQPFLWQRQPVSPNIPSLRSLSVSWAKSSTASVAGLQADRSAWGFMCLAQTSCWTGKVNLTLQLLSTPPQSSLCQPSHSIWAWNLISTPKYSYGTRRKI